MIVSVKVAFLYMDIFQFVGILWIVTSREQEIPKNKEKMPE